MIVYKPVIYVIIPLKIYSKKTKFNLIDEEGTTSLSIAYLYKIFYQESHKYFV